ncbi:glutathione S-transferase [Akanthomyces lecanii RCEF 1005]|uniref:Glutathione S-transferase n=1 Tax=Akanthomyces lecanii RCEF 1005 TaxID=1081108 RepID=A0A168K5V7_CORDF|nr:glutathione S-transferase [Akanthomyces lecanii RCEF 1005]
MSRTSSPPDLKLFRGSGDAGTYVWSPFVTKVEARLRFDGLRYTSGHGSPRSAPRGKIPYMEWHETTSAGDDAVSAMGDSALIIRALVANGLLRDLNAALPTGALRAQDLAVRALLEDRVYFYGTREKWCDNYDEMVENMLAAVPWPVRAVVGWMAQRGDGADAPRAGHGAAERRRGADVQGGGVGGRGGAAGRGQEEADDRRR